MEQGSDPAFLLQSGCFAQFVLPQAGNQRVPGREAALFENAPHPDEIEEVQDQIKRTVFQVHRKEKQREHAQKPDRIHLLHPEE